MISCRFPFPIWHALAGANLGRGLVWFQVCHKLSLASDRRDRRDARPASVTSVTSVAGQLAIFHFCALLNVRATCPPVSGLKSLPLNSPSASIWHKQGVGFICAVRDALPLNVPRSDAFGGVRQQFRDFIPFGATGRGASTGYDEKPFNGQNQSARAIALAAVSADNRCQRPSSP